MAAQPSKGAAMIKRRFNLCSVCGQRHAPAYDYRKVLERFGLKGERAAVECLQKLFSRLETVT
jgi:hypothetical protein